MLFALMAFVCTDDVILAADWKSYLLAATLTDTKSTIERPLGSSASSKWKLVPEFSDEFDGLALNESKWWDHNPYWKGRQPAWFDPSNVRLKDGMMELSIRRTDPPANLQGQNYHNLSTAAVQSVGTLLYGYLECRAKIANATTVSAFWLYKTMPKEWTELDIFEIGGPTKDARSKSIFQTVHVFKNETVSQHAYLGHEVAAPFRPSEGFHVYGLDWTPDVIRYYVDGVKTHEGKNVHWHQPLWVNFDIETHPDWFGVPKADEVFGSFQVDYVRVWKPVG